MAMLFGYEGSAGILPAIVIVRGRDARAPLAEKY